MAVQTKKSVILAIENHGEETYPRECCGFLLGRIEAGLTIVDDIYRAKNEWQDVVQPDSPDSEQPVPADRPRESQQNRYLITPEQYKQADAFARSQGHGIVGYYHSHPDHPAEPSGFDLDHSCWPGESYIIVSVKSGKAEKLNSFTKPDYTKFEKEEITIREYGTGDRLQVTGDRLRGRGHTKERSDSRGCDVISIQTAEAGALF